jgi:hypothetical protein
VGEADRVMRWKIRAGEAHRVLPGQARRAKRMAYCGGRLAGEAERMRRLTRAGEVDRVLRDSPPAKRIA